MAVFADEEEVGVLVVRLLCVGNGAVGTVEAGSLEELTVYRVMTKLQPRKTYGSGILSLTAGILGGIGESCPSVRRLIFWMRR